jgi:hypothetical protein
LERIFCVFAGVFLKKRVVGRGFLMVNLWWKRGELWCVDGAVLGLKNMPRFCVYFFRIPVLGMVLRFAEKAADVFGIRTEARRGRRDWLGADLGQIWVRSGLDLGHPPEQVKLSADSR